MNEIMAEMCPTTFNRSGFPQRFHAWQSSIGDCVTPRQLWVWTFCNTPWNSPWRCRIGAILSRDIAGLRQWPDWQIAVARIPFKETHEVRASWMSTLLRCDANFDRYFHQNSTSDGLLLTQWGDATLKLLVAVVARIAEGHGYDHPLEAAKRAVENKHLWEVLGFLGWRPNHLSAEFINTPEQHDEADKLEVLLFHLLCAAVEDDHDAAAYLFMLAAFIFFCAY